MTLFKSTSIEFVHGSRSPLNPKSDSISSFDYSTSSDTTSKSKMEDDKDDLKLSQKASCGLYVSVGSALLGAVGMGVVLGWTAPAFDTMRDPSSVPRLLDSDADKNAKTWIGSSMTLGALVGALISGPMAQMLGRKKALILYGIPFTIGWAITCAANSVTLLIVGRVITGLSAGLLSGTAPTYVVEVAIIKIRGLLGSCFQLCVTIGILLVYCFGAFINWKILAGISMVPTLLMAAFMIFMPETPVWLLSTNNKVATESALKRLRATDSNIKQELDLLQEQADSSQKGEGFSLSSYSKRMHYCPLLLSLGLMFFQQFSGINAVMFYATNIFIESGSSLEPKYATIVIGTAQVIATIAGSLMVDRLGRKLLLNISGLMEAISVITLGLYYYFTEQQQSSSFGWVPVTSLVVFIVGFSIGYGPIPWLMIAEITPLESRSATSAFATAFNWTCAFLITKNFELLKDSITKHGTFFLFGLFSLISIIFVIFTLPETKGKSSEEIDAFFSSKPASGERSSMLKQGNNSDDKVELKKLNP